VEINHRNCHLKKTRHDLRGEATKEKNKKEKEEKEDQ
jgi:hypothetical protein